MTKNEALQAVEDAALALLGARARTSRQLSTLRFLAVKALRTDVQDAQAVALNVFAVEQARKEIRPLQSAEKIAEEAFDEALDQWRAVYDRWLAVPASEAPDLAKADPALAEVRGNLNAAARVASTDLAAPDGLSLVVDGIENAGEVTEGYPYAPDPGEELK